MAIMSNNEKTKIMALWKQQLTDFNFVSKNICLRLNSFVICGLEFGLPDGGSRYKIRVFVHSFNHIEDESQLFFDGYVDYWYSTGQHGFGPKYIGVAEVFEDFVDRLRKETVLSQKLNISKLIKFYEQTSVLGPNNINTMSASALARFYLFGESEALDFIDKQKDAYLSNNFNRLAWREWKTGVVSALNKEKVEAKKKKFLSTGKRKSLLDMGIVNS